jgi:hypothetical protein
VKGPSLNIPIIDLGVSRDLREPSAFSAIKIFCR